jgi:hypothetical protein
MRAVETLESRFANTPHFWAFVAIVYGYLAVFAVAVAVNAWHF